MRTDFNKLRYLDLKRAWISEASIIKLIKQIASSVRSITLDEVELTKGTWEGCLVTLLDCKGLEHFIARACGYAPDAESSVYRCVAFRPWESLNEIESEREADLCALGDLQRMVARRRTDLGIKSSSRFDQYALSHIDEMPLAQWKAQQAQLRSAGD